MRPIYVYANAKQVFRLFGSLSNGGFLFLFLSVAYFFVFDFVFILNFSINGTFVCVTHIAYMCKLCETLDKNGKLNSTRFEPHNLTREKNCP